MESLVFRITPILEILDQVTEKAEDSKLKDELFTELDEQLAELAGYFKISKLQALITASIFSLNCSDGYVGLIDLAKFYKCPIHKLLLRKNDIDTLLEKKILIKRKRKRDVKFALLDMELLISPEINDAIISNSPIQDYKNDNKDKKHDLIDILEEIYGIGGKRVEDLISTKELIEQTEEIFKLNKHIPLLDTVARWDCNTIDKYLFLYLGYKFFNGTTDIDLETAVDGIIDNLKMKFLYKKELITKANYLCKNEFITVIPERFLNDTSIRVSDKGIELLLGEDKDLYTKCENNNLLKPDDLKGKTLIYNAQELEQLHYLEGTLQSGRFKELQSRLTEKGLPKGIAVLLYGAAGTGKTETVYQLAKKTNREIMHVDISKTKSCWFGESEKLIKQVFDDYKRFVKKDELIPILLFNEADAIISKRKETGFSTVSQTENAIQNIILEELEKFEGILFATTNLERNFDKAFERRFLFKVEFHKPSIQNRVKIWQIKFPHISEGDAEQLSEKFEFSGGQIDNVARKYEIAELIDGSKPDINKLIEFCNEERIEKREWNRIGFRN